MASAVWLGVSDRSMAKPSRSPRRSDPLRCPNGRSSRKESKDNFSRCLTALLGPSYRALKEAFDNEETACRLGSDFDRTIEQMGTFLRKSPIALAQGVSARSANAFIQERDE